MASFGEHGKIILVCKQNQISIDSIDFNPIALDYEIRVLPIKKKVIQAQLYILRNSKVSESLLSLLLQ